MTLTEAYEALLKVPLPNRLTVFKRETGGKSEIRSQKLLRPVPAVKVVKKSRASTRR